MSMNATMEPTVRSPKEKHRTPTRLVLFASLSLAIVVSLSSGWLGLRAYTSTSRLSLDPMVGERVDAPIELPPTNMNINSTLLVDASNALPPTDVNINSTLPALIDGVFLLDAIWVPQESKVVLLAMSKTMFQGHREQKYDKRKSKAYSVGFSYDDLEQPMTLVPHLSWNNVSIRKCNKIYADARDANIDRKLFILHCPVRTKKNENELSYKNTTLAKFDAKQRTFNAAPAMAFDRTKPSQSKDARAANQTLKKVSIAIMPISSYSPLVPDLIDYYQKQGVEHVYFGLINPAQSLLDDYSKAMEPFKNFVSFGWFNSTDVVFDYNRTDGHVLLKIMFSNSVLYHAKACKDDLLMVADLDDVLVSMKPTETSFVEELNTQFNPDTCYGVVSPRIAWRHGNRNSTRLGERFPSRCKHSLLYEKSVAVLSKNGTKFAGIHQHGACPMNTKVKKLDESKVTLHHYTSWWRSRANLRCATVDPDLPSELAIFQRDGFRSRNVTAQT